MDDGNNGTPLGLIANYAKKHHENDTGQLDDRNLFYTDILKNYSIYIEETLSNKIKNKDSIVSIFLFVFSLLCILFPSLFIYIIINNDFEPTNLSSLISLGATFASFIGTILIIPKKIAEYTFNPKETDQISGVIKNIQDYDKAVRDDMYKNGNDKN